MGFQTPQHKLSLLLERAGDGRIQLPDFQRGYKWDEERIRSLLASIAQGHPLGVVMLLQTGNDHVRFKPKALEGTTFDAAEVVPEQLLLDGQQRLTSLYQSLTGMGVVHTEDARRKQVDRRFYLDIAKALAEPDRLDTAVVALPGNGIEMMNFGRETKLDASTPDKEREHGLFPFRIAYNPTETFQWLVAYAGTRPDGMSVMEQFHATVVTPLQSYQIPAIELDKTTTKSAVATVFQKVNQGGLSLTVFELLTSLFAGDATYFAKHGTDFRLNDDWELTRAMFSDHPVLSKFDSNAFLQVITLLASQTGDSATTARRDDVLKLELNDYLRWAGPAREALIWVAQFLHDEHIHRARDVPYPTQLVPLTAIRVLLADKADVHGIRMRLRQWYWNGVLGELYGGSTETRFARDVEQVPAWASAAVTGVDAPVPFTVAGASFTESRLHSLRRRNSAAYNGLHALLLSRGCRDWRLNKTFDRNLIVALAVDIHHVFPQKWCKDHGIEDWMRESIINKTPLAGATNRFLSGASPATYMAKLQDTAGVTVEELDAIIAEHLIDPSTLRTADFTAFFLARRQALLGLVEEAMGKPAQHDVADDALTGGLEDPADFADGPDDVEDADLAEQNQQEG